MTVVDRIFSNSWGEATRIDEFEANNSQSELPRPYITLDYLVDDTADHFHPFGPHYSMVSGANSIRPISAAFWAGLYQMKSGVYLPAGASSGSCRS